MLNMFLLSETTDVHTYATTHCIAIAQRQKEVADAIIHKLSKRFSSRNAKKRKREEKTEIMHHLNACAADASAITANMAATTKFVMKLWWLHIVATCVLHTHQMVHQTLYPRTLSNGRMTRQFFPMCVCRCVCVPIILFRCRRRRRRELFLNRNAAPRSRHKSLKWNRNWFGFLSAWLRLLSHTLSAASIFVCNNLHADVGKVPNFNKWESEKNDQPTCHHSFRYYIIKYILHIPSRRYILFEWSWMECVDIVCKYFLAAIRQYVFISSSQIAFSSIWERASVRDLFDMNELHTIFFSCSVAFPNKPVSNWPDRSIDIEE